MLSMPTDDRQGMPDGATEGSSAAASTVWLRTWSALPRTAEVAKDPCAQGDRPCVQGFGCRTLETRTVEGVIMMFWYDHNMGWWGYAGMGIGMILFWALLIVGIVALIRYLSDSSRDASAAPPPTASSPEQLLADRFARGEIDEAEFQQRRAVLRDHIRH